MSFDIFLIPSTASPPPAMFDRVFYAAVREAGGRFPPNDLPRTSDGLAFDTEGGDFHVSAVTPGLCKIVFAAARRTNAYIVAAGGGDVPTLKIKGAPGRLPGPKEPVRYVASYQALCAWLEPAVGEWQGYARQVHRNFNR